MKRVSTGIETLDGLLQGGFPEGATILLLGRPGSGKTIFAHQMMFYNASPEFKVMYLTTLAEPQVKVLKFQQEFSFFDREKFQKSVFYQDLGYILRKYGPAKALTNIDELMQKYQPRLLVIDTIKTISDMISSFTEFREFILDLSVRLTAWGCTSVFIGEYNEEDIEVRPESALADGIIVLSGTEEKKQQKRFLRVLKMRGTGYSGGENVFKITGNGIELFPRLNPDLATMNYENFQDRLSIGIPEIDRMMEGGIPHGTITLLSGAAGTGKTIIALHFSAAGIQVGEPVVYISFEENLTQIIKTATQFKIDIQEYLTSGKFSFMHVSPMELDVDEHVYRIQQLVKNTHARRLVIDSISAFEIGMEDKIKYTNYIWALTEYFKALGVSIFLTHESYDSQVSELTKYGVSYVADNLILLRYLEIEHDIKCCIRIVKMRSSNHATNIRQFRIKDSLLSFNRE